MPIDDLWQFGTKTISDCQDHLLKGEIMFNFFRKDRKNDAPNIMTMIPVTNCESRMDEEKGTLNLLMPRYKQSWLSKLVPPKRDANIVIHLDDLGTFFWTHVDGRRTVLEIGKMMMEAYPDKMKDELERAGFFAQRLYRQDFLVLKQKDD